MDKNVIPKFIGAFEPFNDSRENTPEHIIYSFKAKANVTNVNINDCMIFKVTDMTYIGNEEKFKHYIECIMVSYL